MGRHLLPGSVLAGKFRVERVIGEGGMGVVVAAHHLQLDGRVALKIMRPEAGLGAEGVQRFLREAQAVAKLKSEHVARVLDVGSLPDGAPYIVMEYLEGHDLAAYIHKKGPLPVEEAIDYVLQACAALAEAHRLGIVHRDLKPANLFLAQDSTGASIIKILDFGISKQTLFDDARADLTSTRGVVGSPSYMSPEQLKASRDVDGRTDIWSLGIVLYELLTGRTAFDATTLPELHVAILSLPPAPVRQLRGDVPPPLESIFLRCLEKDPRYRFQTVAELAAALGEFAPPHARGLVERIQRTAGVGTLRPGESSAISPRPAAVYGQATLGTPPPGYAPQISSQALQTQSVYGVSGPQAPVAFTQTQGGYLPAPPPPGGPSVIVILSVLAIVIGLVALLLVCGFFILVRG